MHNLKMTRPDLHSTDPRMQVDNDYLSRAEDAKLWKILDFDSADGHTAVKKYVAAMNAVLRDSGRNVNYPTIEVEHVRNSVPPSSRGDWLKSKGMLLRSMPSGISSGSETTVSIEPAMLDRHFTALEEKLSFYELLGDDRVARDYAEAIAAGLEAAQLWSDAARFLELYSIINEPRNLDDPIYYCRGKLRCGIAHFKARDLPQAENALRDCLRVLGDSRRIPPGAALKTEFKAYNYLSRVLIELSREDGAKLAEATKILEGPCAEMCKLPVSPLTKARYAHTCGLASHARGEWDAARAHFIKAAGIRWEKGALSDTAESLLQLGNVYAGIHSQAHKAIPILLLSSLIHQALRDESLQALSAYYQGRAFEMLIHANKELPTNPVASIEIGPPEALFPDKTECSLLVAIGGRFHDREARRTFDLTSDPARNSYGVALELAKRAGYTELADSAQSAVERLTPRLDVAINQNKANKANVVTKLLRKRSK